MSDKTLEDKAVEILDASQQALGTFADKMAELAKQYGPDVADAALQMARIDAISTMIPAVVGLIAVCLFWATVGIKWASEKTKHSWGEAETTRAVFTQVLGGLVSAIIVLFALIQILDIWRWVGIFEPKLWLAKRILGL